MLPENRAVLAVVGDGPDAGRGLDESLIAVVVGGSESLTRRREERGVGDFGVLVELISRVDGIHAALGRCLAVADVVEIVRIAVVGINGCNRVGQLAAIIVTVSYQVILSEGRTRL